MLLFQESTRLVFFFLAVLLVATTCPHDGDAVTAFVLPSRRIVVTPPRRRNTPPRVVVVRMANPNDEGPIFYNDFEGFGDDDSDDGADQSNQKDQKKGYAADDDANPKQPSSFVLGQDDVVDASSDPDPTASQFVNFLQDRRNSQMDWTAIQTRQFSLGQDLVLSNYVGNMGFDEVTDWEYYLPSEDEGDEDRQVVQPNPFDQSKPKRTRTSSGSVVRIFRGEFVGLLGGVLSSQGLDRRLLVKEFTGDLALSLARAELEALGRLQSKLLLRTDAATAERGEWIATAAARSSDVERRRDCANVAKLVRLAVQSPFLTILGEVNLAELEGDMEPNDFYRSLGVPPPKAGAVWVVYEYAGLSTLQAYAQPAEVRRASLPIQKGFFGNLVPPPPLPAWKDRAKYVVKGIMKGAILALAEMHESGVVHRSIGRSSFIISTKSMDKREAISPYNTMISNLSVKLADFGFSGLYETATMDEEFCVRARSFGMRFRKGENSIASHNFAIAEDMHALGFVFLGLLLNALAEVPDPKYVMPATDEDTLQRLLSDIFNKNFAEFREYVEAEDIWTNLVELLDEKDGAGWKVLETLVLAREKAVKNKDTSQLFSIRGLLSNPFFNS